MNDGALHTGHRERMINRFLANPDVLPEHELLEILLFGAMPRKDTNPLAHRILRAFGDLKAVFNASVSDLMSIEGVGKRIATEISVIGKIFRIIENKKQTESEYWTSFYTVKKEIVKLFNTFVDEQFIIVLLTAKMKKIVHLSFEDKNKSSVTADIPEIVQMFAVHKPKCAIVAHNHPSGNSSPSEADDFTTKKLFMLCQLHGVDLLDHVIVTNNDVFSYERSGLLDEIKEQCDFKKILPRL